MQYCLDLFLTMRALAEALAPYYYKKDNRSFGMKKTSTESLAL